MTLQSVSIFGCKEYNQSDFSIDHLVMSMCRDLCYWERVFAMTSAFSWQNSISLCSASFHIPRPNLSVTPGVLEKAMATHTSTLAWKIPGGLQSMGSLGVGSLSFFTFMHWRRKWQPTPVFLPGESPGRESLVGCRLWGRTESDTTEAT